MPDRFTKLFVRLALLFLSIFVLSEVAPAKDKSGIVILSTKDSQKAQEKSAKELPELPEDLDQVKINEIVAGLSDDRVRRLLIRELERTAAGRAKKYEEAELTGFARLIQSTEENITLFHKRLTDLRSGAIAVPNFLPKAYADLRGKGGASDIIRVFAAIAILLVGGLGAELLFGRYAADMRKRLIASPPAYWTVKIKRLLVLMKRRPLKQTSSILRCKQCLSFPRRVMT